MTRGLLDTFPSCSATVGPLTHVRMLSPSTEKRLAAIDSFHSIAQRSFETSSSGVFTAASAAVVIAVVILALVIVVVIIR